MQIVFISFVYAKDVRKKLKGMVMPNMMNLILFALINIGLLQFKKGRNFCWPIKKMQNLCLNIWGLLCLSQKVVATRYCNLYLFGLNKRFLD